MNCNKKGFTLIELMMVCLIMSILWMAGLKWYWAIQQKMKYDHFTGLFQSLLLDARNRTMINEADYDWWEWSADAKCHWVIIEPDDSEYTGGMIDGRIRALKIFEYKDSQEEWGPNYCLYDVADEILTESSITDIINVDLIDGIQDESDTLISITENIFEKLEIVLKPDLNFTANIKITDNSNTTELQSVRMLFSRIHPVSLQATQRKLFTYGVIGKIANMTRYPGFTGSAITSNTTVELVANEKLNQAPVSSNFKIICMINGLDKTLSKGISQVNSILLSDNIVTLAWTNFESCIWTSDQDSYLRVIYSMDTDVKTANSWIVLQARNIKINTRK